MSSNELIGPETNLYFKPRERGGMAGLAGVGEHPQVITQEAQKQSNEAENEATSALETEDNAGEMLSELQCGLPVELDYGGDIEGMLFTFQPYK